ncbi:uncharacterized protein LOC125498712 [Beta vulgaris subsp. vulgaris]|uniref:uncharacterized protein LOC125498712 n=1 Tax=Beta vulgaris subsp. vulgaris TaxID=3555 RepID=UPI002036767B|nr:uncharacterized protein LOC125498712 [Beta vulgaris subsp. vulgaris]
MQSMISDVIDLAQAGFMLGRNISDNILLATELINGYKTKHISPRCMMKVDLKKAYDSIEWPFLHMMMNELGFPSKFIGWVTACISFSILINSTPCMPFKAKKGLRQGDPMSPFRFAIRMEADHSSLQLLFDDFSKFSHASSLVANLEKIHSYVTGVTEEEKSGLQLIVQMPMGSFPLKYLGVPLTTRKLFYQECKPLIEKTVARVNAWSVKKSGQSEGNKKAPIAWDTLCMKKSCGGWNLKDLVVWNKVVVAKHLWAITQKQDRIWIKWIHAYYIKHINPITVVIPVRFSWTLKKILVSRDIFMEHHTQHLRVADHFSIKK